MNLKFFGDSYDIVKQSLLRWLEPCGAWKAHPMFTPPVEPRRADEFERFLGVRLVSREVLDQRSDRKAFLKPAKCCQANLFLDPDTGLWPKSDGATPKHLMSVELAEIAKKRPDKLTLVFDQSFSRSLSRNQQIKEKLACLKKQGIHGVAYESHACFVLVSQSKDGLDNAVTTLLRKSRLPPERLVRAKEDGG